MATSDELNQSLNRLAESWLKRPLTAVERQQLQQFQLGLADKAGSNPAALARQQVEQAIEAGKQQTQDSIRQILQNVQSASTQALQAHENGEQAILKAVTAAHSLADLHPATSGSTQAGTDPAATAQIASRLEELVKNEVQKCFEQNFGALKTQLENAIATLNETHKTAPSGTPPRS